MTVTVLIKFPCIMSVLVAAAPAQTAGVRSEGDGNQNPPQLSELVDRYFHTNDPRQRASIVPLIDEVAVGSTDTVVDSVRALQLWLALPDSEGLFSIESGSGRSINVAFRLPEGYDPTKPYPVLLCMPDRGVSPERTFALAYASLGDVIDEFVLVSPSHIISGRFHQATEEAGDLRRMIIRMRRLIHTDTDRVYAFGYGEGGEAAWMSAITHSDLLAGAISLAAFPRVPFPDQLHPCLLANLRQVPVLSVWRTPEEGAPPRSREALVDGFNRAIVALGEKMQIPLIGVEVPRDVSVGLKPPAENARALFRGRRAASGLPVSHWFRYPDQGQAGWLRQTKFAGDVWEAEQMSVLAEPPIDRDRFIKELVRGRLAYLGGKIDGQTITVLTQKCEKIEIDIPAGDLDLAAPITVRVNDKHRLDKQLVPDLGVLLESAYRNWEFQRFTIARLSFTIRADGSPP